MNQKTLLDEFAMAAMVGWLSSRKDSAAPIDQEAAANSFYHMAEAMMAERAKRTPQPLMRALPADPRFPDGPMVASESSVYTTDAPERLLTAIASFSGRKVTCSEICEKAYGWKGDMKALRTIGEELRSMGFAKVRSGGKDCYQL